MERAANELKEARSAAAEANAALDAVRNAVRNALGNAVRPPLVEGGGGESGDTASDNVNDVDDDDDESSWAALGVKAKGDALCSLVATLELHRDEAKAEAKANGGEESAAPREAAPLPSGESSFAFGSPSPARNPEVRRCRLNTSG